MTMICVHTQWHKHHVFGQSRDSLDTGRQAFEFCDKSANFFMLRVRFLYVDSFLYV